MSKVRHNRLHSCLLLHTVLLHDEVFCKNAESLIEKILGDTEYMNPKDRWESLKMQLGMYSKIYAKRKLWSFRDKFEKLRRRKAELEFRVGSNAVPNEQIPSNLLEINKELEEIAYEKVQSSMFWSQCRYALDGKRCSETQICYTEDDTPDSPETMYTLCNIYALNAL